MQSISITFTRAASGVPERKPGFAVIWLMVLAIAILDDSERREQDRARKRNAPRPPAGPRPF